MSVRVPNLIECFTGWVVDMSNCWMLGGLQEGSSEISAKILFGKVIFSGNFYLSRALFVSGI